jgi:hypothetical protein
MADKNGLQTWSDFLSKGLLVGLVIAAVKWLLQTQQDNNKEMLRSVVEAVSTMSTQTVAATSEAMVATIKGPLDSEAQQVGTVPENDLGNPAWTEAQAQQEFDAHDWTDYTLGVVQETDDGNRVASVRPGESIIPGIPRPDLGGESYGE